MRAACLDHEGNDRYQCRKSNAHKPDEEQPMRNPAARSKYSFLTALAAITTITVNQLHGVFRPFLANVEKPPTLVHHLAREATNQSVSNHSLEARIAERVTAVQQDLVSKTVASTNKTIEGGQADDATNVVVDGSVIPNVTIVCEMAGELGNHLGRIARCVGIALWLERKRNISSHIVLRLRQTWGVRRWEDAQQAIRSCFPRLSAYNFKEANTEEFTIRRQQQAKLKLTLSDVNSRDRLKFEKTLAKFVNYTSRYPLQHWNKSVSLPFIYSSVISSDDFLVDHYVDDIRMFFGLDQDNGACCSQVPDPDETVFHFRNFAKELPRRADKMGFQELGPNQTAHELFGHLKQGDKVAIISRFNLEHTKQYVKALTDRGLRVRFIQNQTGIQDFCFLMRTQKEVVGTYVSTYFKWAALLSNASNVTAYSLDVPAQKRRTAHLKHYPFKNPQLVKRWKFPKFKPKE